MNNLTRPFLPRGILRDDEASWPLLTAEPFYLTPYEMAVAYWRPRTWRLQMDVEVGFRSFIAYIFTVDIHLAACNKRLQTGYDPVHDVSFPTYETPMTELDLTRTQGTEHLDYRFSTGVRVIDGVDHTDEVIQMDMFASLDIFTKVLRHNDPDPRLWRKNTYKTYARGGVADLSGAFGAEIGFGDSDGFYASFEAPFDCVAFSEPKMLKCQGLRGDISGLVQDQVIGTASIKPLRYWPYADRLGMGPKFDEITGMPLDL